MTPCSQTATTPRRPVPELPEVETVRAGLAATVLGREIVEVDIRRDRSVRRHLGGPADLACRLRGRRFISAVRRGKYLWLGLGAAEALLVHLGMSGQVLVRAAAPGATPVDWRGGTAPGHLRVRLRFADDGEMWFVDQRTFGHLAVADLVATLDGGPGGRGSPEPLVPEGVEHIARDVLDPLLAAGTPGRAALVERIHRRRTGIKRALLDQTLVSGVGNIYADEGLWRARVHYGSPSDALPRRRVAALLDGLEDVMLAALAAGGTSFDALYVNVNGASGYFDRSLVVYGQAGTPCPRCGALIVREPFMNRSSYRCPRCQAVPRTARRSAGSRGTVPRSRVIGA